MGNIISFLNNREWALVIWLAIGVVWAMTKAEMRKSGVGLLKILFGRKLGVMLAAMTAYIGLIVFLSYKMHFWSASLLKDTVIWYLGTASVLFFHLVDVSKDTRFFRKTALGAIKILVVVEFIVNFYVFNFFVELALVPIMAAIGGMLGVAEVKPEYAIVKRFLERVLALIILVMFGYALVQLVIHFRDIATIQNLRSFLLPMILTIAFMPFVYFAALFIAYETLFVQVKIKWMKDPVMVKVAKREVLKGCRLSLQAVIRFTRDYSRKLYYIQSESDLAELMIEFKRAGNQ